MLEIRKLGLSFLMAASLLVLFASLSFAQFSPFKFAVISDPHVSVDGPKSPANDTKMFKQSVPLLEATVREINKKNVDFVVVLGDLTKDAEPWNVDKFKEIMSELDSPYFVVLGNHDVSPVDTRARNMDPGGSRGTMIWTFQRHGYNGPGTHWSLDPLRGVHLIGLDSTMTGDWGGRLTREGLQFLDRDLAANQDKLTIVIVHHQLLPYTKAEETGENDFDRFVCYNASDVRATLQRYPQVAMVLSGHRHLSTRYKKEGKIPYFTMSSTVTWPMRYSIFEVTSDQFSYHTYDVPCEPEVWNEAKANSLAASVTEWPRWGDTPNTPEGNEKLEKIVLSPETMSGRLPLQR